MEEVNEQAGTYSEEKFDVVRAQNLPLATIISDNDMLLVVQGGYLKRALPSAMKGKKGDAGLSAYLGVTATYIQWKQGATGAWQNLLEIERLRGPKGEKPLFRKVNGTLQMKYEGQPDSAFVNIFDREELKLKFIDLTPAEVDKLKLHFSDLTEADIIALQKPATEAAAEVRRDMDAIKTEATKVNTDLTEAIDTLIEKGESAILATNTAKEAAITATDNTNEATRLAGEATGVALAAAGTVDAAKQAALNAAKDADEKAEEARLGAVYANEQGEYARKQGEKAAALTNRIVALEEGKIDGGYAENNELILTSGGIPIGDPIPVGSGTGGGGGAGGVLVKVLPIGGTLLSAILGGTLRISYNFSSIYLDDQTETGDGTATYLVNSQKVAIAPIRQGANYFDVTKYLTLGTNKVKVSVLDSTGQTRSTQFTVEVISLSLSDSYDDTLVNTGAVTYRYTPIGAIEKTIHFVLDGEEIDTEVTSESNRQHSRVIPVQTHGAHRLEVYMTATVNNLVVRSNTLAHDLICTVEGNNTVIVASPFNQSTATQYDKLAIPFVVYNPSAITSTVVLSVGGVTLSEQTVDRRKQTWNYRLDQSGTQVLKIASGGVSRSFILAVTEAETVLEAETADLALHLTAQNRSNNDNNKSEWKFGNITAALTDFNFKTNGWIVENGSTVLRVSGDARVSIPFRIFDNDFRAIGKTIEFESATRDVIAYAATVISCLSGGIGLQVTAQEALFKSEQTTVDTRFKEEERVRIAFVVEKKTEHRLIYIYINGILSGVARYSEDDNFQQSTPTDIVIGSNDCTVDIYNIRIYNNNLTQYQVLNNFIADIDDYDRKMEVYDRNQVYDEYGNISYPKVLEKLPCMILEGTLPTYKGDKKTVAVDYADQQAPTRSFDSTNVQIDVQGTSSQYYPRKNFKTKHKGGFTMDSSGDTVPAYALRPDGIATTVFCQKADFAESSGSHNTGMAKIADQLLKDLNFLVPPQRANGKVRTTIDGFPICIFHRATPDSPIGFVGKYNFNYDKGSEETFGFTAGDESWEFCNNTSDRVLFKSADFTTTDWLNDFEARYPDDDDINAEYEAGTRKPTNLMAIMEWVVSTIGNASKFKAEASTWFDVNNLLAYYLFTELFAMVDQRAKNMFLTRYAADGKWRFILYDNDTCLGINNEGLISFGYNVEYHDKLGTQDVWNGESSELWKSVEAAFPAEIEALYKTIRTNGYLSYNKVMSVLNGEQSDKWCEAIYNADGRFKYIDPLIEEGNGSYLYAAQGSRVEHRKWWAYNRFLYMDSKYNAGDFLSDFATMRLYTPQAWEGVTPNSDFTIIPYADQYVRVKYGSYILGQRGVKDATTTIKAPDIQFNDTETIIYGASRVKSIGDLSAKYPGTVDVSRCTRLTDLQIGSSIENYHNDNLMHLSVGANKMLRRIDLRNCPNLTQAVDLSGCENIEEVYAQGTGVTAVVLPPAGILRKLYLPGTVTNLALKNQPKLLDAFFEIAGVETLTTVVYDNTPINVYALIDRCLSIKTPVLSRVRLIDIDGRGANLDTLYKLTKVGGIDENGNNISLAVVTGKFHAVTAAEDKLSKIRTAFPELTVTYTTLKPPTITTFVFTSSQSKTITNSSLECSFEYVKVDERTYKVTADDDTLLNVSFKCDNHKDFSAEYLVAGTRTQTYSITYIPLRKIRVQVYNQSIYPPGASIVIGENAYVTDKDGYISIRSGEAVEGVVAYSGYGGSSFSFSAITNDTSNTVYVYAVVEVKFIVKDDFGRLLSGLQIECDGKSGQTNLYGECILLLGKGEYPYTIKHPSIYDYTGKVVVGTSASTVNASVVIDIRPMMPEPTSNIQMLLVGSDASISVDSTTSDYIIDWGDGSTTNATGTGSRNYGHTYKDSSLYQVDVTNCTNITRCIGSVSCLVAYWSVGVSKVNNVTFSGCSKLKYFGNVFKNDSARTNCSSLLYGCSGLTSVDLTPLAGWVNVTNCYNLLSGCSGLTSVDLTPLAGWVNVTSCSDLLYNCRGLTSVDLTPLAGWVNVTNCSSLLYGCSGLTSVDLTPLAGWVNVTNCYNLLSGCSGLTSVDLTPLAGWVNVTSCSDLLYNCRGLTSVDLTALVEWTKLSSSSSILSGCYNLTCISVLDVPPFTLVSGALTNGNSCPIYVPNDAVETYKTATNWSAYAGRIKPISEKPAA